MMLRRLKEKMCRGGLSLAERLVSKKMLIRPVEGPLLECEYEKMADASPEIAKKIARFHAFDVVPLAPFLTPPLTQTEINKIQSILQNPPQIIEKEIFEGIETLAVMNAVKNSTRQDFGLKEWKALDEINFMLLQEHMNLAYELFSIGYGNALQQKFSPLNIKWKEAVVAESLAKTLAFIERLQGRTIDLPIQRENSTVGLVKYQIHQTYLGDRLPCYVLLSNDPDAPAWFVARGTEFTPGSGIDKDGSRREFREGGRESVLADFLDDEGLGQLAIAQAMHDNTSYPGVDEGFHNLDHIFKVILANKKIVITGHSLGGCIANTLAVLYSPLIDKAYAFSAPGVSKTIAQLCPPEGVQKIVNFDIQGDIVPASGDLFIGQHFALPGGESLVDSHLLHNLLEKQIHLQKVDVMKENNGKTRQWSRVKKKIIAWFFRLFPRKPRWWTERKILLMEYSKPR